MIGRHRWECAGYLQLTQDVSSTENFFDLTNLTPLRTISMTASVMSRISNEWRALSHKSTSKKINYLRCFPIQWRQVEVILTEPQNKFQSERDKKFWVIFFVWSCSMIKLIRNTDRSRSNYFALSSPCVWFFVIKRFSVNRENLNFPTPDFNGKNFLNSRNRLTPLQVASSLYLWRARID